VDDLLDVSRISSGKVVLQRERVDLRDVVRQGLETSQHALGERRHTVQLALPEHPVPVLGDPARLAQVVTNLLNNAAKYTDPGGLVALSLAVDGPNALVSVRDNGHGLDRSEQARIFEPFFQVATELERSQGGLGLGLSLVRNLVELHGGRVQVHSDGRGRGSCFCVHLPLAPAAAAPGPAAPTPAVLHDDPGTARSALRVLVVDDLPDAAESLAALLQLQGHAVVVAHDGLAAVEAALRDRPDLVLLDIALPGLNGHEACRAMRDGGLHDALIVALSGHGQREAQAESRRAGFDEHLVKPVDWPVLQAVLARCVQRLQLPLRG
jgi:CheY-like chemotaxis protein/anti-sigma regulatory factor (Ser/Thr protein kinase)